MDEACYVVLLKSGRLDVHECLRSELFGLARERDAGICGVFTANDDAERFVLRHSAPAKRTEVSGKPFVIWRRGA